MEVFQSIVQANYFSQVPVDEALEQTINADAKNRLKGIMKYADVATAVNRWKITNSTKTEFVNSLLEMFGMVESSYGHKETQTLRKKKDNEDQKLLKHTIIETSDPFENNLAKKEHLFNIKTGRRAIKYVTCCGKRDQPLLNAVSKRS